MNTFIASAGKIVNTDTCSGEMAEREPAGVYCVGCGSDLTSRSTDRRSLQSSASEHVATVWNGTTGTHGGSGRVRH